MTKMKAPTGVSSATIQDHPYSLDKSGIITVVSDNHIVDLKRHGFVELDDTGEPNFEEMTPQQLVTFIEERGGEADEDMKPKKLLRLAREAYDESKEA